MKLNNYKRTRPSRDFFQGKAKFSGGGGEGWGVNSKPVSNLNCLLA